MVYKHRLYSGECGAVGGILNQIQFNWLLQIMKSARYNYTIEQQLSALVVTYVFARESC